MKKIIALTSALSFALLSSAPGVYAESAESPSSVGVSNVISSNPADVSGTTSVTEPTVSRMEQMIRIVKPKLNVPDDCVNFDWNYTSPNYYRTAGWNFTWYNDDNSVRVNVTSDENGNITNYSVYNSALFNGGVKLPKFTKSELEPAALKALEQMCPEAAQNMRLISSESLGSYSKGYVYNFARYENDVIVPDNTASVSVNYITGEITSLRCNYNYGIDFNDGDRISQDQAKQLLGTNQTMNLSYRLKTEYDDNGNYVSRKAYLVYTPEKSYISVDALTGEVYTERNTWNVVTEDSSANSPETDNKFEAGSGSSFGESEYQLTEEELEQLGILESLISRKDAIDTVLNNEYLYIEESATAADAYLTKQNYYPRPYYPLYSNTSGTKNEDHYVWNISFSAPYNQMSEENGYYYAYMNACVDAHDGTIISFSSSIPGYRYYYGGTDAQGAPKPQYTSEQAQEFFKAFANTQIPEKMALTRLGEPNDMVVIDYLEKGEDGTLENPVYRCTGVNFVRVNEGVDFNYNSVYGSVDRVTGKVTEFGYTWYDDVVFESPEGAITPEAAYDAMLNSDGFGLNYEINSNYTYNQYLADSQDGYIDLNELYETNTYARLVYSGFDYASSVVSALTGELLDYSGEVITDKENNQTYNDIEGHWAQRDIQLLKDLGLGLDGESFMPDAPIKSEEFLKILSGLGGYVSEDWGINGEGSITRTQAVKYIIDAAGYEKIAGMPDIFITDFADNSELKREDVGFIAIARGMGLVQGDASLFRPYDEITRAEAVTLIFNFVELS